MRAWRFIASLCAFAVLSFHARSFSRERFHYKSDDSIQQENGVKRDTDAAFSLLKRDRNTDALAAFENVLETDSTFFRAHYGKGLALRKLQRPTEAISALKASLRHAPNYAIAYFALGNVYSDLEKYHEAIAVYNQALQQDPKLANAYYHRGLVHQKLRQPKEAISSFRAAIAIDPNLETAHHALGLALAEKGELQEAVECFQRAARIKASEGNCYRLAETYNKLNKPQQALEAAELGLKKNPAFAPAAFEAGVALKTLGRTAEAITKFQIAATDSNWKQRAEDQIEELNRASAKR